MINHPEVRKTLLKEWQQLVSVKECHALLKHPSPSSKKGRKKKVKLKDLSGLIKQLRKQSSEVRS